MFAYLIYILTLTGIYAIVMLAYAVPLGYAGMVNFGEVGLLAVGAYTAAILTTHGVSFWLALPAAALASGLAGFLLSLPARRVKGDYYALITLGFIFIVNGVIVNWTGVTGGPFGISGIRRPAGFEDPFFFFLLVTGMLCAISYFVHRVLRSPFGRALEAVRDDDVVAESLGKPTAKLRMTALTLSAILTGLAGALLAHFIQFINGQIFWLDNAVFLLAGPVVGGLASFRGVFAGTALVYLMFESVRFLPLSPDLVGPVRLMAFSGLLLLVVLTRPKGLLGRAQLE